MSLFPKSLLIYLQRSTSCEIGTLFPNTLPNSEKWGTADILTANFPT